MRQNKAFIFWYAQVLWTKDQLHMALYTKTQKILSENTFLSVLLFYFLCYSP